MTRIGVELGEELVDAAMKFDQRIWWIGVAQQEEQVNAVLHQFLQALCKGARYRRGVLGRR